MKKTLILVADPDVSRAVPGYGIHNSAGHAIHGNKPAILEVRNPASRGDPNSPVTILERGNPLSSGSPLLPFR